MNKKKIDINFNKELFRWGPVPGYFIYAENFVAAVFDDFVKRFGYQWPDALFLYKKGKMLWINEDKPLKEIGGKVFEEYMLKEEVRNELYNEWCDRVNQIKNFIKNITPKTLSSFSNEELAEAWDQLDDLYKQFWVTGVIPEFANYGSLVILEFQLRNIIKNENDIIDAMEVLTAPEKPSFYQEEEILLSKTNDIDAHIKKYFWLKNSYGGVVHLTKDFFEQRKLKLVKNIEQEVFDRIKNIKKEKERIKEKYNLSDDIIKISKAITMGIEWQDERKKYIFELIYYQELFLEEIVRRYGYKLDALHYSWGNEISEILKGKDLHKVIENRSSDGIGIYCSFPWRQLSQEELDELWVEYGKAKVDKKITKIKGTVACKGVNAKITGIVRIVLDPRQINDFKKGDILVAAMTSPDYVFVMKKASAIITDNGGLTSHAAIVSRELNVPCVIGTKYATQVLKDGMEVEVDADNGVVKIIK